MVIREVTLYHLTDGGHIITTKAMSLDDLRAKFGNLRKLEVQGMRIIKAGKRVYERPTEHSLCKTDYIPRGDR